ncbi:GTPase-associated system all-helical protein GASH [Hymenobacter edaphi]|uniref:GTPase-associated system all-helical protein GASH n=1 Tax=Hymenobacter edaphi TaxID=2211146 RepID=UPI00105816B9|nr:GTPase-associated system all-helical protein GASH [Hymenobacter edaphi]
MAQSILQSFLNEHIITIDQNEEFGFLQKAVSEFEKKLRTKKSRISTVVQLAFDPETDPAEPLVAEVQDLITSKWKAFPSKCKDRPIPYVRAVMLAALQQLSVDVPYAGMIWLTASNFFSYMKPLEREASILLGFLEGTGALFEQGSLHVWGVDNTNLALPSLVIPKASLPAVSSTTKEYIVDQLALSIKGDDDGGNKHSFGTAYNSNYGNNHNVTVSSNWVESFSIIAGATIKAVADAITTSANKSLGQAASVKMLEEFTQAMNRYLNDINTTMQRQTASHNLRGRLLWLKETLYSTSQQTSYRRLPLALQGPVLAHDAAELVPAIYPASVEYFLRETLREASADTEAELTFADLLPELAATPALQTLLPVVAPETGRMSLSAFLKKLADGTTTVVSFEAATGVGLDEQISRQEMAVWLFRELQVLKLAETK